MIIGLAGAKRSGKNTVANFISDEFSRDFKVTHWSFAEDLKKSAAASLEEFEDGVEFCDAFKEQGTIEVYLDSYNLKTISGREFLQYYGTEAHRDIFGDDFWVNNLLNKIITSETTGLAWEERLDVITDVRFPNEAEAINAGIGSGNIVARINRPSVENSGDAHASEIPLHESLLTCEIPNEGTLGQLREDVIHIIGGWIKVYA
jgi:hypothetical protein